jgi:hypothetical protein
MPPGLPWGNDMPRHESGGSGLLPAAAASFRAKSLVEEPFYAILRICT